MVSTTPKPPPRGKFGHVIYPVLLQPKIHGFLLPPFEVPQKGADWKTPSFRFRRKPSARKSKRRAAPRVSRKAARRRWTWGICWAASRWGAASTPCGCGARRLGGARLGAVGRGSLGRGFSGNGLQRCVALPGVMWHWGGEVVVWETKVKDFVSANPREIGGLCFISAT